MMKAMKHTSNSITAATASMRTRAPAAPTSPAGCVMLTLGPPPVKRAAQATINAEARASAAATPARRHAAGRRCRPAGPARGEGGRESHYKGRGEGQRGGDTRSAQSLALGYKRPRDGKGYGDGQRGKLREGNS